MRDLKDLWPRYTREGHSTAGAMSSEEEPQLIFFYWPRAKRLVTYRDKVDKGAFQITILCSAAFKLRSDASQDPAKYGLRGKDAVVVGVRTKKSVVLVSDKAIKPANWTTK